MNKKLSKKEREEFVTKGYLEDQGYATKDYIDIRFEFQDDKLDVIFEELRAIREENGRRLEICESRLDRVENNLKMV
jgi:arginine/ornithine N-succinyltransferase beta subunit